MSETPAWHVGQEVIYRSLAWRGGKRVWHDQSATVTRIGRKYVYVDLNRREEPFLASNGKDNSINGSGSIGTAEMFAARDQREALETRVRKLTGRHDWVRDLSTDTLTQIADLIEGEGNR